MNWWLVACGALLVGGVAPGIWLALRGPAAHRLVGLELTGAVGVLAMLLWCQAIDQPSYLVVPLVMVLLSLAGTLVFTRLLGPHR